MEPSTEKSSKKPAKAAKPKAPKVPKVKKEKAPKEPLVVFAFGLAQAEREDDQRLLGRLLLLDLGHLRGLRLRSLRGLLAALLGARFHVPVLRCGMSQMRWSPPRTVCQCVPCGLSCSYASTSRRIRSSYDSPGSRFSSSRRNASSSSSISPVDLYSLRNSPVMERRRSRSYVSGRIRMR